MTGPINLAVVALFIWDAWMRHANPESLKGPMALSFVALCMLVVSGWLGGKMVYEAGVGVNESAAVDQPSPGTPAPRRHAHL